MNEPKLFEVVWKTVKDIDNDLKEVNGTGIYFAPELYIAFCMGKEVFKNRQLIFGSQNDKDIWHRETDFGSGGPSDIAFEVNGKFVVIELKLRDTLTAYDGDIRKLQELKKHPKESQRYFCVLLDSFKKENDDRLVQLESTYRGKIDPIGHDFFATWNNWYNRQVFCNLNLYRVL